MLSSEGIANLNLLKGALTKMWNDSIVLEHETVMAIPVDAFEIQMTINGSFRVLLEYETGTFALKLWTGDKFEYLDKIIDDKIYYGFDSMLPDNIYNNLKVLEKVMNLYK